MNVATVALANKTARMAWSMIRNELDYEPQRGELARLNTQPNNTSIGATNNDCRAF